MVVLMNEQRHANGCSVDLVRIDSLTAAARRHSIDMATNNFIGHTGSDGSTSSSRAADAGFAGGGTENAAAGNSDARSTLNQWLDDQPHRAPILNCDLNVVGIGYAYSESSTYKHYWTADFGRR
jgi:uncharacterized protein YkwD